MGTWAVYGYYGQYMAIFLLPIVSESKRDFALSVIAPKKTTKIVFNLTSATWIDLLVWPRKVIAYLPFP